MLPELGGAEPVSPAAVGHRRRPGALPRRLFEILKAATGKGKAIKWRGQKQEGKTRWRGRNKPPVRLSALYANGDKEAGVVTGAEAVLAEVRAQATKINGEKETFPAIAAELMDRIRPFPEQQEAREGWEREVCTWERFERAVGRAGADVGVGGDGYSGYLTRKAALSVQRIYYDALLDVLATRDFPPEWKLWECVLLMKPGEDPRELGRRRDIWLMPHSLKVASRMLMLEYESVACQYVPGHVFHVHLQGDHARGREVVGDAHRGERRAPYLKSGMQTTARGLGRWWRRASGDGGASHR